MNRINKLEVYYHDARVGTMALYQNRLAVFEYDNDWTKAFRQAAEEANALLAPVGELWWEYRKNHPEVEMYAEDNAHASREGSEFAADCIWNTIKESCEQ